MAEKDTSGDLREDATEAPASAERRRFLSTATAALGVCAGGVVLFPVAGALLAPLGRRTVLMSTEAVDVGAVTEFKNAETRRVVIRGSSTDGWLTADTELGAAWVTHHPDGRWSAFSAVCPHLGCAIDYTGEAGEPYFCPCHSSSFADDGAPRKGPSPRGLDELPVSIQNGRVMVEYHRYVLNTPQKLES
jgi:Rieske Fe-S protein